MMASASAMRYLRWLTCAAGLLLIAGALANYESMVNVKHTFAEQDAFSGFEETVVEVNVLPALTGLIGFGLVSFALMNMRGGNRSR